jgi:hypothetical protein
MARRAIGKIVFEYDIEEHPEADDLSSDELQSYFLDTMVDDLIDLRYSDIRPAIEMEII